MAQGLSQLAARLAAGGSVCAEEEAELLLAEAQSPQQLEHMVAVRLLGQPLEYVLGRAWLAGVRVAVESGVFVPRVRTELLVREAVARVPPHRAIIVDMCCGSGAVGAADPGPPAGGPPGRAAFRRQRSSGGALRAPQPSHFPRTPPAAWATCMRRCRPAWLAGCTLSSPTAPHVPSRAVAHLPREAHLYEAPAALDGGADGLDVLWRVAAGAPARLAAGGHVLVEASPPQAPAVFESHGFSAEVILDSDREAASVVGTLRLRVSAAAAG